MSEGQLHLIGGVKVEKATLHVLDKLIDIKGHNKPDVVNFILKDWIGDHFSELEKYGITIESNESAG